ncbi:PQQ-binding-like beta-propeller repeat protein [Cellulomonas sp. URHE0023]|uniref:outer membrane protein assembly factor BamB family protein n=1 Tax=Cellulomonas sp. URHE0023 TaxID=1380354 RepID=UPI000488B833|nr:PQQ-binding-like beta-propeller repeat protein [Cellulomonas sp. URHE0023]
MGHRSRLQSVELLDEERLPDESSVDRVPEPRRRAVGRWWPAFVAVVAVALLAGTQELLDTRQRAAEARFATIPGVVRPVGPDVRIAWQPPVALAGLVREGIAADGAFVGLSVAGNGSQAVVAVDQRTGDVLWSTTLFGPDASRALSLDRRTADQCARATEHRLACLVSNGYQHFDRASSPEIVPATSTRVVVLDTRDGRIVADRPVTDVTSMAVFPGLAVLGARDRGVTAQDLLTGEERWRYLPPSAGVDLSQAALTSSVKVFAAGDLVGVTNPGWSVALLDASGAVVRPPVPAVAGYRYDKVAGVLALLSTTESGQVRSSIVRAGLDTVDLPGTYLEVSADDASLPDLVLTADGMLRGWDARTGQPWWTSQETATGPAVVLRGRVYVPTMTGIVSLDGRTGSLSWRSAVTPGHVPGALATDGSAILVADQPVAGSDRSELVAYDLDDGHPLWRAPLPADIRSSTSVGRVLLGLSTDGVAVLG